MKKLVSLLLALAMLSCVTAAFAETLSGKAYGFANGVIEVSLTLEDGKITSLDITSELQTPTIGGAALDSLKEAILASGTIDGVDAVAGATITSNGLFKAIRVAMGQEASDVQETSEDVTAQTVGTLNHGIGVTVTPRLGPGSDDQNVPVYSFNVVAAYVLTDAEGRIVDLEVDILEIITPNHDGAHDNYIAGWPGSSYNNDADADGVVDGIHEETEETFTANLSAWQTKRGLGENYVMNSGTWTQEMDAYESVFKGMTAAEVKEWAAAYCSDVNGRALHGTSTKEEDIAKWDALSEDEKAALDAISTATMSLTDAHGNIVEAIEKAAENQTPVTSDADIARMGFGIVVTPRLGPGSDDQGVPVYSFNVVMAGALYDGEDRMADLTTDILEVITPNHDGAHDNVFTGWPGQSYNNDSDADGVVDGVLEQTEETFTAQFATWQTKRELGENYVMNSGTWTQEMDVYESVFKGMTAAEVSEWVAAYCSDVNGRALHGTSTKEEDIAKWDALSEDEKASLDAISTATMSLTDAHGNLLSAIEKAFANAKTCLIEIQ